MVEHKLLGEKKILLIIEKSALPEKYKKAYITYIKIFIEDLESSTFCENISTLQVAEAKHGCEMSETKGDAELIIEDNKSKKFF